MKTKVIVGMSGGVDSTAVAYLLKEQGFEVIGATMATGYGNPEQAAESVCERLGIRHMTIDCADDFRRFVIDVFADEYLRGRTPNPCTLCNRRVKFETLLAAAETERADYIATGHYACVQRGENGRFTLKKPVDKRKDQTYMLYALTQEQLSKTMFPLADYNKDEVREITRKIGIFACPKPDSQDICFVEKGKYGEFVRELRAIAPRRGNFLDTKGNIIGEHGGIINFTVGQRRGLKKGFGERVYVQSVNAEDNTVTLGTDQELYSRELSAGNVNFVSVPGFEGSLRLDAKIRYSQNFAKCAAKISDGILNCCFDEPQRAITPGQPVALYDGDYVVCGGIII